jgi:hypothetical protein
LGEREKKAISLPEIRAEDSIKTSNKNNEENTPLASKTKLA